MNILICDYDNTILFHKNIKQIFKKIKLMKNKKYHMIIYHAIMVPIFTIKTINCCTL